MEGPIRIPLRDGADGTYGQHIYWREFYDGIPIFLAGVKAKTRDKTEYEVLFLPPLLCHSLCLLLTISPLQILSSVAK